MYSEELEICERVRQAGREVWMTPQAKIIHMVGGGSAKNPKRMMVMTCSRMHVIRKHHNLIYATLSGLVLWLHAAIRCTLAVLARPMIGSKKSEEFKNAFAPIMLHPARWWSGWTAHNWPVEGAK